MIFRLDIDCSEEDFIRCMCSAWQVRYGDGSMLPEHVKPFALHDEVATQDVENMLMGSSLGELAAQCNHEMKRVE